MKKQHAPRPQHGPPAIRQTRLGHTTRYRRAAHSARAASGLRVTKTHLHAGGDAPQAPPKGATQ